MKQAICKTVTPGNELNEYVFDTLPAMGRFIETIEETFTLKFIEMAPDWIQLYNHGAGIIINCVLF